MLVNNKSLSEYPYDLLLLVSHYHALNSPEKPCSRFIDFGHVIFQWQGVLGGFNVT